LGLYPPLSLLRGLLDLLGGRPAGPELAFVSEQAGLRRLRELRWPSAARPALAALLLRDAELHGWEPPAALPPTALRPTLSAALSGEPCPPRAPAAPLGALRQAAERIDERLLTLLQAVGPSACAADPALPLRLAARAVAAPLLPPDRRAHLAVRVGPASGTASGAGLSTDRAGLSRRGDARALTPGQWALPREALQARQARGELLYRAPSGAAAPRLRAAVLILDVSPPCFGPVEAVTRACAHAWAQALLQAGLAVGLVTVGGSGWVGALSSEADLAEVWTRRSLEAGRAERALRQAEALGRALGAEVVGLLSGPWLGFGDSVGGVRGLRGLFVGPAGWSGRPLLAALCSSWLAGPADRLPPTQRILELLLD
jgi:ATP-dependent Clp protease ATP-binding subunit ClpC